MTSSDLGSLFTQQKESIDTFLLPASFLKTLDQTMLSRDFVSIPNLSEGYQIDNLFYGELAYSSKTKKAFFRIALFIQKIMRPRKITIFFIEWVPSTLSLFKKGLMTKRIIFGEKNEKAREKK